MLGRRENFTNFYLSYSCTLVEYNCILTAYDRDLSVDERSADGEREGGDVLQRLLAVRATFQLGSATLPGDETNDGRRRTPTTQPACSVVVITAPTRRYGRRCRPFVRFFVFRFVRAVRGKRLELSTLKSVDI